MYIQSKCEGNNTLKNMSDFMTLNIQILNLCYTLSCK